MISVQSDTETDSSSRYGSFRIRFHINHCHFLVMYTFFFLADAAILLGILIRLEGRGGGGGLSLYRLKIMVAYTFISSFRFYPSLTGLAVLCGLERSAKPWLR